MEENASEIRWEIEKFGDRLRAARPADQWASPLFVLERREEGLVFFFLQFYPKGLRKGDRPLLFVKISQFTAPQLELCVVADVWLEAGNGEKSEEKAHVLEFKDGSTYEQWECFFSFFQLEFFDDVPGVSICLRLRAPFPAKQVGTFGTKWEERKWKIPDFSHRLLTATEFDTWDSRDFEVEGASFFLRLHPNGTVGTAANEVALFLHASKLGDRAALVCEAEVWLENENGDRLHKCAASVLFHSLGGWGCGRYAKQKRVREFAAGGAIFVRCRLRVWREGPPPSPALIKEEREEQSCSRASTVPIAAEVPKRPPTPPVHVVHPRPPAFHSGIAATFDLGPLSDAEVHSKGKIFKVSRAILAASSARFWSMFTDETAAEAKSGIVSMDRWDPPLVHSMLLFIYGAPKPEWTAEEAERLLPLAVHFEVEALIVQCSGVIVEGLNLENIFDRLEFADRPEQPPQLKAAVFRFARQNLPQLARLERFSQFVLQQPTIITAVCAME